MAHHQHGDRRPSAVQNLLKMLRLTSNAPTVLPLEDELTAEGVDEPPDDTLSPLPTFDHFTHQHTYHKSSRPSHDHRESLLTRAIRSSSHTPEYFPTSPTYTSARGLSTTSSHSTASTAELTSDDHSTPPQSTTPSPRLSVVGLLPTGLDEKSLQLPLVTITSSESQSSATPDISPNEAAIEKTLGRKRCIMFACGAQKAAMKTEPEPPKPAEPVEKPKRKCMLTFACPLRTDKKDSLVSEILESRSGNDSQARKQSAATTMSESAQTTKAITPPSQTQNLEAKLDHQISPHGFHEFGNAVDEPDAWVDKPIDHERRLTLTDCLRKENAIRQLGEEAEEEAEAEDADDNDNEDADRDVNEEDDFAPSDEGADDGNESDDEEGFADSDDESNADSEDRFWAPSTTTAQTSMTNISMLRSRSRQRSPASSLESSSHLSRLATNDSVNRARRHRAFKAPKMRPGTPELPDSTDFVCGTLDEDRPLEAAYIACREQKKRDKHILIPQDIDPSFPTSDPDDNDDNDDDVAGTYEDEVELSGLENTHTWRGRTTLNGSPALSPKHRSPTPQAHLANPDAAKRKTLRSPPPTARYGRCRSPPPPRRLFGHSPTRLHSPPPVRSPRGSPTGQGLPLGITINRLAQRPPIGRRSSLPLTPNPFFRNYQLQLKESSNTASGAVTPGCEAENIKPEMHVRGPVDIVIGLEKKRQKRKEKFWRQHCRKAAKEAAERKHVPGKGAERMKELGLECAERARQYGLQQPEQLVISL